VEDARDYIAEGRTPGPTGRQITITASQAMLEMAAEHGVQPRARYVTKCHLCWKIREVILAHYLQRFAPAELYENGQRDVPRAVQHLGMVNNRVTGRSRVG
jgi:hypothetical protein